MFLMPEERFLMAYTEIHFSRAEVFVKDLLVPERAWQYHYPVREFLLSRVPPDFLKFNGVVSHGAYLYLRVLRRGAGNRRFFSRFQNRNCDSSPAYDDIRIACADACPS